MEINEPVEFAPSPEPVECAVRVTECEGLAIYFILREQKWLKQQYMTY
jgi:hypothetical protein